MKIHYWIMYNCDSWTTNSKSISHITCHWPLMRSLSRVMHSAEPHPLRRSRQYDVAIHIDSITSCFISQEAPRIGSSL